MGRTIPMNNRTVKAIIQTGKQSQQQFVAESNDLDTVLFDPEYLDSFINERTFKRDDSGEDNERTEAT